MEFPDAVFWSDASDQAKPGEVVKFLNKLGLRKDEHFVQEEDYPVVWKSSEGKHLIGLLTCRDRLSGEPVRLLTIYSPAVYIPRDECLPFYRKLLDINLELPLLSVGVCGNAVTVNCIQPAGLLKKKDFLFVLRMVDLAVVHLRTAIAREFNAPLVEME